MRTFFPAGRDAGGRLLGVQAHENKRRQNRQNRLKNHLLTMEFGRMIATRSELHKVILISGGTRSATDEK
jgi:hypothetical protein